MTNNAESDPHFGPNRSKISPAGSPVQNPKLAIEIINSTAMIKEQDKSCNIQRRFSQTIGIVFADTERNIHTFLGLHAVFILFCFLSNILHINKKVLCEGKRHTAYRVASTHCAALSQGELGVPVLAGGYLPWLGGGTYPAWEYLPWPEVPTLAGGWGYLPKVSTPPPSAGR